MTIDLAAVRADTPPRPATIARFAGDGSRAA
jgi:hypothetical protein